eukprot:TRINITY_DN36158_c0_g1_i1.p1 TRINITY_DN36158_c0_g1~~TRINITY_DN36158_c0_g1_i1.p1  ORF type:complete len:144 (+),score=20.37 TRINITY_DN36158_c0_g1_i1:183-614(+)
MPRKSSRGRTATGSRPSPLANPPQQAKSAPAPAPATVEPRGGGIGAAVADGLAWGTGTAIAHRAMDSVLGPRTVQHEVVKTETAPPVQPSTVADTNGRGKDACATHSKAFQECLNHYGSDISKCQFYIDMLNECRRSASTVAS